MSDSAFVRGLRRTAELIEVIGQPPPAGPRPFPRGGQDEQRDEAVDRGRDTGHCAAAPPGAQIFQMWTGVMVTQLLEVALGHQLPRRLLDGARSSAELAEMTGLHEPSLYRVLRALTMSGSSTSSQSGASRWDPSAQQPPSTRTGSLGGSRRSPRFRERCRTEPRACSSPTACRSSITSRNTPLRDGTSTWR